MRAGDPAARDRLAALDLSPERAQLHDAQLVVAREYGFASWSKLSRHVQGQTARGQAVEATVAGDRAKLQQVLDEHPEAMDAVGGPWDLPLLHLAAWHEREQVVDELLARGFPVNQRCRIDNSYALHFAAERGHMPIVKRLVEAGTHVKGNGDDHQLDVLGWATCLNGLHENVADYLLENGGELHIFSAVALSRGDEVRRIVAEDPTQLEAKMSRNEHHRRPLHLAVVKNRPEMVKLLIELGAEVNAEDDTGATPINCPTLTVNPQILTMLEQAGAKLDLIGALRLNRPYAAEAFLTAHPDALQPGGRHANALGIAVYEDNPRAVWWLIAHGGDVNAKPALWGVRHTPLHVCMEHGRRECAQILLEAGADPNIRDETHDATALGWAQFFGRHELAELVRQHGGR